MDPERKIPAKVPTIPRNVNCHVRKAMESLKKKVYFEQEEESIWLIGSSTYDGNEEGLVELFLELEEAKNSEDGRFTFSSWQRYSQLRSSFYTLKNSNCYAGYISCTCPEGIKDEVCKHSLMLMESENLIDPLPQPLEGRQKRGWKRKIGHALERI